MNFVDYLNEMSKRTEDQDFGYDAERREYEYNRYYQGGKSVYKNGSLELVIHSDGSSIVSVMLDHDNKTIDYVSRFEREIGPSETSEAWSQYEVWKDENLNKNVTDILIKYVLPELKLIVSDSYQTKKGEKMWKNILKDAYKNHECGVYDTNSDYVELFDGSNLEDIVYICYSNSKYRFFVKI